MSREQAERLTQHVTEILCSNKERLAATYVSQTVLEKVRPAVQGREGVHEWGREERDGVLAGQSGCLGRSARDSR